MDKLHRKIYVKKAVIHRLNPSNDMDYLGIIGSLDCPVWTK